MFKNYIKTAWRNLKKSRFYSFINMAGLGIALAVGLLIVLWVKDEFSYDAFHHNAKNIYRLENMVATGVNRQLWTTTAAPIGYLAKKEIPGVLDFVRISYNGYYGLFRYKDKIFDEQNRYFTDASFFSMFDFGLIEGDPQRPFPDHHSMVISESIAKKYFGNTGAVGRVITADDSIPFKVTGVIRDIPKNSSIQGDMFFPMELLADHLYTGNTEGRNLNNDFMQYNYDTYLLLKPGFNFGGFAQKLRNMHLAIKPDDTDIGYVWLTLPDMHLHRADGKDGGIGTVRLFMIIGIVVLLIGSINYVNLSTARSLARAREVSMRKLAGAARYQLFVQFIVETLLLFVLATLLALALAYLALPFFNRVSGKELAFRWNDFSVWQAVAVTIAATLLLSSIYPALVLSSFDPMRSLRGKITTRLSSAAFRKVLVVAQFALSMILITGTLVIGRQLHFMESQELGFDKTNVFSMPLVNMGAHMDAVKATLRKDPAIHNITWASAPIINNQQQTGSTEWDGKQKGETMMVSPWGIDENFLPFFHMQLAAGQNFTGSVADSTHFILNETAVKAARIQDPIGKRFKLHQTEGVIVGVVKDFHFTSLRQRIKPTVFYYQPEASGGLYIRTTGGEAQKAIAAAQKVWGRYNAGFEFRYQFLDESYDRLYKSEQRTDVLFSIFSGLAIVIACMGLLGLTSFTAQVRTREIGIRKVLGASVPGVVKLLAMDFIRYVLLAVVVAIPVAWYAMHLWLQDFAYRVALSWWIFVLAGLLALTIAIFTISFQTIRSAVANPVKALRSE